MKNNREIEQDLLRIFAILAVIVCHVCGMETHNLEISDTRWQYLTFIYGLRTWTIPVFVMISGRFFLDNGRKVNIPKILRAILRLAVAFVIWDIIYQIFYISTGAYDNLNWKGIASQTLIGPYHFWFIWMIIGLYAITPFLRRITAEKSLMEYYILMFLIIETITSYIAPNVAVVGEIMKKMHLDFFFGYTGLFIAGLYFKKYPVSRILEIVIYILSITSILGASVLNVYKSIDMGVNIDYFTQCLRPNVAIEAFAIYTLFTKRIGKHKFGQKTSRIISKISLNIFGVYLSHAVILEFLAIAGLSPIMCSPFLMVPIIALIAFIISLLFSFVCSKIPVVGRYLH